MAGASKAKHKVDYFTEEDERRILAHPNNQATFPTGVRDALYGIARQYT